MADFKIGQSDHKRSALNAGIQNIFYSDHCSHAQKNVLCSFKRKVHTFTVAPHWSTWDKTKSKHFTQKQIKHWIHV